MRFAQRVFGTVRPLLKAGTGAFVVHWHAVEGTLQTEMNTRLPKLVARLPFRTLESRDAALIQWAGARVGVLDTNLAFLRCGKQGGELSRPILGAALMRLIARTDSG